MRLHYMLFVVASAFLLANSIVASADTVANPSTVATTDSEQGKSTDKRSLRIRETEEDDGDYDADADDEERGRVWLWLQQGLDPKQVHTKLGLDGLGPAARKHENYAKYLKFSEKWWKNQ